MLTTISPLNFSEPFSSMTNQAQSEELSLEKLNLSEMEETFTSEGDSNWFTILTVGRGEDDQDCVKEAFESKKIMLSNQNCSLHDIVKIWMYVDTMESYAAMNRAYVRYWGLNPPVRVCVAVERLPPGARLVLQCRGQRRPGPPGAGERRVLHVQGLSHWAPANIGPYSQVSDNRFRTPVLYCTVLYTCTGEPGHHFITIDSQ